MRTNENAVVYNTEESAYELNKVRGFDPMKYARNTEGGAVLDLPYQKLWFRLRHPNGRIGYFIKKISGNVSAVEARVFFDRRDSEPAANHIISGVDFTDKTAVAQAQRAATEKALSDAGFGLQFLSSTPPATKVIKEPEKKVINTPTAVTAPKTVKAENGSAKQPQNVVKQPEQVTAEVKVPTETPVVNTEKENGDTTVKNTVVNEQAEQKKTEIKTDPLLSLVNNLENKVVKSDTVETGGVKIDLGTGEVLEDATIEQPATESVNSENTETPVTVENEVSAPVEVTQEENNTVSYDKNTPVEEICKVMTLDDAMKFVIEGGPFNGMRMETLAKTRPIVTFDTIISKYPTKNNILTAAAIIVRDSMQK